MLNANGLPTNSTRKGSPLSRTHNVCLLQNFSTSRPVPSRILILCPLLPSFTIPSSYPLPSPLPPLPPSPPPLPGLPPPFPSSSSFLPSSFPSPPPLPRLPLLPLLSHPFLSCPSSSPTSSSPSPSPPPCAPLLFLAVPPRCSLSQSL